MTIQVIPKFRDITKVNNNNVVYIKGSEFVDGSIRLILNPGDDDIEFEKRKNGIWNATDLKINSRCVVDDNSGDNMSNANGNLMIFR